MSILEETLSLSEKDLHERFWAHDADHLGFVMTPLFQSFIVPALDRGLKRAAALLKFPVPPSTVRIYHGYYYRSVLSPPQAFDCGGSESAPTIDSKFSHLGQAFQRTVREEILPTYEAFEKATEKIETVDQAILGLQHLSRLYDEIFEIHMRVVLPVFAVQEAFEAIYLKRFPDRSPADAHALLSGHLNKFLEADRQLAEMARTAIAQEPIRQALMAKNPWAALLEEPAAIGFMREIDAFKEVYGWRVGTTHDFYQRSWREDLTPVLAIIRQFIEQDYRFERHWEETVAKQKAALEATLTAIGDPDDRQRFLEAYHAAYDARPIDEDHHFYIDAMLPARVRPFLLRLADWLVGQGLLRIIDEIFFLYADELEALANGIRQRDLAQILDQRRLAYAEYQRETPPPSLGISPECLGNSQVQTTPSDRRQIRGISASTGCVQGAARVISGPEEFARFQAGEVLIARATTPVWSPLFAIAGAVVTDSGGILSHAATVAREYRVPCVVGTKTATQVFRDGELVLVDGLQGTVSLGLPASLISKSPKADDGHDSFWGTLGWRSDKEAIVRGNPPECFEEILVKKLTSV